MLWLEQEDLPFEHFHEVMVGVPQLPWDNLPFFVPATEYMLRAYERDYLLAKGLPPVGERQPLVWKPSDHLDPDRSGIAGVVKRSDWGISFIYRREEPPEAPLHSPHFGPDRDFPPFLYQGWRCTRFTPDAIPFEVPWSSVFPNRSYYNYWRATLILGYFLAKKLQGSLVVEGDFPFRWRYEQIDLYVGLSDVLSEAVPIPQSRVVDEPPRRRSFKVDDLLFLGAQEWERIRDRRRTIDPFTPSPEPVKKKEMPLYCINVGRTSNSILQRLESI